MRASCTVAGFAGLLGVSIAARAQTVIYVDRSADQSPHDGSSWCHAYQELYEALTAAGPGAVIRVAEGTFTPDASGLTDPREASFRIDRGLTLEGGFAGCGAADPDMRDKMLYETILSGDLEGNDVAAEFPGGPCFADNAYHVVRCSATTSPIVLDGVVVSGGNADGAFPLNRGGGLQADGEAGIQMIDCVIRGNSAVNGAGMVNYASNARMNRCLFTGNAATARGGGLVESGNGSEFVACAFIGNTAGSNGGGVHLDEANPKMVGCSLIGNSSWQGGGLYSVRGGATLSNCVVSGNYASRGGGAYSGWGDGLTMVACTLTGNTASDDGGGVYVTEDGHPVLINCALTGNTGGQAGGGIYNGAGSYPDLFNCTVSANTAPAGGGMFNSASWPTLRNAILWGNVAPSGPEIMDVNSQTSATYCCIRGGWPGAGNIAAAPRFSSGFRLAAGSPCIDAGDKAAVPSDLADLDRDGDTSERTPLDLLGVARLVDDPAVPDTGPGGAPAVDIGAFEYRRTSSFPSDLDGDGDVDLRDFALFHQAFTGP